MMKDKRTRAAQVYLFCILLTCSASASIKNSPHNLTALAKGNMCNFCHTPHGSFSRTPIWNHKLSDTVYKIYESSSLDAKVGQPTGSSKLCLSCHDGTVALTHTRKGRGRGAYIAPGSANLGTDLSDDHPISFVYSDGLATKDIQLRSPSALPQELKLDRSDELQCTTCHDPHDNTNDSFLVISNRRSQMCLSCHNLEGWYGSSHEASTALVTGSSDSYLKKSKYNTVADNGCNSCHRPHSAGGHERLLHFSKNEDNCLNCHNGSVARTNLKSLQSKRSRHDIFRYNDIHDLEESALTMKKHVECEDCHNPHSVQNEAEEAPLAPGAMRNVSGMTISGGFIQQVQYEYEVCFKCHADNPDRVQSDITRQLTQTNTRLEFDPGNPSYHPVVSPGVNQDVPSLIQPLAITSIIYCTDCHNSDSRSGLKGPHGSNYSPILRDNYETADFTQESVFSYALCYRCHSRNSILNDESFPKHSKHLENEIPCSICHDSHGISAAQGSSTNNSHLINFDTFIVSADSTNGRLEFQDLGVFRGQCFLKCHGKEHSPESY